MHGTKWFKCLTLENTHKLESTLFVVLSNTRKQLTVLYSVITKKNLQVRDSVPFLPFPFFGMKKVRIFSGELKSIFGTFIITRYSLGEESMSW